MISSLQCVWFYRWNPAIWVRIHPQYFSSNVKTLIQPQPGPGICSFSRWKGKRCVSEVSCKLENTGHHHHKAGIHVKRSCCYTSKSTFWFFKTKNKIFRAGMEEIMVFFFFLPGSFAAVQNFHIALLVVLLANSHSLIYKITGRTNRHVCLLPQDLCSREFKQQILH